MRLRDEVVIKTLDDLRKLEGRILHIIIEDVCPHGPGESEARFRIIETGNHLSFIVNTEWRTKWKS